MKYIKLYKDKESAVGQILETPVIAMAEGKTAFAPQSLGEMVKITEDFDFEGAKSLLAENTPVDLGLPSGLKWAAGNLGAVEETDPGLYYMWGDTEGYAKDSGYEFSKENYTARGLDTISTKLTLAQDAANVRLGGSWRMPTNDECVELFKNTDTTWTTINGVTGCKFANKTDASKYIFMPAAGYFNGTSLDFWSTFGCCWSSTFFSRASAYALGFVSSKQYNYNGDRYEGYSVRGVCE